MMAIPVNPHRRRLHRRAAAALAVLIALAALPGSAAAWMLGPVVDTGGGSGRFTYELPGNDSSTDIDATAHFGISAAFDTGSFDEELLSYRISIGLEGRRLELANGIDYVVGGIILDNTLRLTFAKGEKWALWAGPGLRLAIYGGESEEKVAGNVDRLGLGAIGIAGTVAYRRQLTDSSASIEIGLGVRQNYYGGEHEITDISQDVNAENTEFFLTFGVLFDPSF